MDFTVDFKSGGARALTALALAAALTGCDRGGIRVYQAPKDIAPPPMEAAEPAHEAPAQITWTLPTGWEELPASQMRVGHFAINGEQGQKAQVTIIPLAGEAGGNSENVNRWRGQVGASRLTDAQITEAGTEVKIGTAPGRLFDFAGRTLDEDKPTRIIAAILHREGMSWFFKMIGDDSLVAAQKPNFVKFLGTIAFVTGHSHAEHAAAASGASTADAGPESGSKPGWTVPAGWTEQSPGPMQVAKFAAHAGDAHAEVMISALPGDAGGKLPNVNRWRGQIGLPPITEGDLATQARPLEIPGADTYMVDFNNEATKRAMVAVAVSRSGQTWFYKLLGETAAVSQQKAAFLQFVQTTKYAQ